MPQNQDEVILILITSTALILMLVSIVVVALLIQKKRKYRYQKQLAELQGHYEKIQLESKLQILEETFAAISKTLHDNVGSNISTAMLLLYKDDQITETEFESNRKESLIVLDKVVDELKNISHSLNPDFLDEIGLNEAIKLRVDQLIRTKKYKIDFYCNEAPQRLNRQKQLILFYVFQEAINNINKHANAGAVNIRLEYEPERMLLQVADDGKGISPQSKSKKGTGLMNMKNHAAMIAGALEIKSGAGTGTQIRLSVTQPYNDH